MCQRRTTTFDLEQRGQCAACESALYLDAATSTTRCPRCETKGARAVGSGRHVLDDNGSVVDFVPSWLQDTDTVMRGLLREVEWRVCDDVVDGSLVAQPREIAYEATGAALGVPYAYEGLATQLEPREFSPTVLDLRRRVERAIFGHDDGFFNSAHLNLYRSGADHVSWHADEDDDLYGENPVIASLSLGCRRTFAMRRAKEILTFSLDDGALLVMAGATQKNFDHSIRKDDSVERRVNITFRRVLRVSSPDRQLLMPASILTGPEGTRFPVMRDALLSTAFAALLPLELLTLGSLSRGLESLGYMPGRRTYDVRQGRIYLLSARLRAYGVRGDGLAAWLATTPDAGKKLACAAALAPTPRFCLVFCGGNAGDLGYRIPTLRHLATVFPDADIASFDYAGFGLSEGASSEATAFASLRDFCDSYRERRGDVPLVLYGHSMGASVAIDFATSGYPRRRARALVLDGPPASIFHCLGCGTRASLAALFGRLDYYPNHRKIGTLECPVFILHGLQDPICPPINARRLYDAAPPSTTRYEPIFWVPGATHGDCASVAPDEFARRLRRFVNAALGLPPRIGAGRDG
ncbi:hypothetical protein CTAYLR_001298 [Chrysophaeum taylorii]|uniref:Fe2OG dioxygenase domain-containing protein n=1 Tax=Chrysophaeum taylorii TaxID=2483200 RepID=A0AAD7UCS4_9STRA|nr:hypothetical protein CTAYLR_001298 [Chrysophaeum taylorii]